MSYPEGFQSWPLERRNAWFAGEARKFREGQAHGNGHRGPFDAGGTSRGDNPGEPDKIDLEIAQLAKLTQADYERERKPAAGRLGFRALILDKLVAAAWPEDGARAGQGRKLELPEPVPWPEPVNGEELIGELEAEISRYVALPKGAAFTIAIWVLHTHCFDSFMCTPRLAVTAPEKRCGKTTLLDVLGQLVPRALPTGSITAAALFRTIELARPVLLLDEADTFLRDNEELRGVLNQGHRQRGQLLRTVGDDHEPRAFSVHSPVAIAMIGKLPGTLADRSIHIEMRRAGAGEKVAKFRIGKTPVLALLARKAARWIADNAGIIGKREPEMPAAIYNRAADNWEPLIAIAEVAGARAAGLAACGIEEEQSLGTLLLADIREVFEERRVDKLPSAELMDALAAMLERPWPECRHGKPINQNWLARRLRDFGIGPGNIGPRNERAKGYELTAFKDAFSRYLPKTPFQTVHADTFNGINDLHENQTVHKTKVCTVQNRANTLNLKDVAACTVQNPESGPRAQNEPEKWEWEDRT